MPPKMASETVRTERTYYYSMNELRRMFGDQAELHAAAAEEAGTTVVNNGVKFYGIVTVTVTTRTLPRVEMVLEHDN
jgi:hypothetical protein